MYFFHFVPFSVRKIAVYLTYFDRTRTKSVLKFRILLITESSVFRKGSFYIIGQHFYLFFSFKSYFHMKLIIPFYSKSHDSFSMNSLLCFSTALFAFTQPLSLHFCTFLSCFFTCKEVIKHNITLAYFCFTGTNSM